ncbi:MAG: patatin-like phospholipase family protein, partial [Candidatus Obscuribacterales bacterium]|nr:patatin-like phospholipase family protein [Candidatus Obscuribacterales bacterium]
MKNPRDDKLSKETKSSKPAKSVSPCKTKVAKCKSVDPTKSRKCAEHTPEPEADAPSNMYLEVVLGGGGIKGYSHFGVQKYFEENNIKVDAYLGISVGAIVAALLTNGYSWSQAKAVFDYELNKANKDALINLMDTPCPLQFVFGRLFGSKSNKVSMTFLAQHMVAKYNLKPQPNLRILAYDRKSDSSIVFEGTDYNLVKALAGSCSIPGVVHPVIYQGNELDAVLLDGQLTS